VLVLYRPDYNMKTITPIKPEALWDAWDYAQQARIDELEHKLKQRGSYSKWMRENFSSSWLKDILWGLATIAAFIIGKWF